MRYDVPVLNPVTGLRHRTLEKLIESYQDAERRIEAARTSRAPARSIDRLEAQAQEILDRIEAMHSAIEEGGGDEFHEPPSEIVTAAFALAYARAWADPEQRQDLLAFLQRGVPVWEPPSRSIYPDGTPAPDTPGYWSYPALVYDLRKIVAGAGGGDQADATALIEAARDAYEARYGLRQKLRRAAYGGQTDPVGDALRFIGRKGRTTDVAANAPHMRSPRLKGRIDALSVPQGTDLAMMAGGVLAVIGLASLAWVVVQRKRMTTTYRADDGTGGTPADGGTDGADGGADGGAPDGGADGGVPDGGVAVVPAPAPSPAPTPTSTAAPSSAGVPPATGASVGLIRDEVRDTWNKWSEQFEGRVHTMYQDVKGLITSGVGNLMDCSTPCANPMALALAVQWLKPDGTVATPDEVTTEWRRVKAMPKGLFYTKYATPDALHLSDATIDALVIKQLDANAVILQKFFPDFAAFPAGAQRAILSIAWAVGAGFPPKWPKFSAAVKAHDWTTAAEEGTLSTVGNAGVAKRNDANKAALLEAAAQERR